MSKKQGKGGTRGAKGRQGATGAIGKTGRKGSRGERGLTGAVGKRGAVGPIGRTRRGTVVPHVAIGSLNKQIDKVYGELEIQMKRMAQVQAELDDVRGKLQQLAEVVRVPSKS
jgi:hypothetical protein